MCNGRLLPSRSYNKIQFGTKTSDGQTACVQHVIGKRLSLLTPECNRLLSAAAVIGREFALETLKAVVSMDEYAFMKALKEAVQLSVLEERSQVGLVR